MRRHLQPESLLSAEINPAEQRPISAAGQPGREQPSEPTGDVCAPANISPGEQAGLVFRKEPPRRRSKDHLAFVRSQARLVCQ